MEQKKLSKGKNIPNTLSGGFYYLYQSDNKQEFDTTLKKFGKPKTKTKVVKYQMQKERGFFESLFSSKVSYKTVYVLYVKD